MNYKFKDNKIPKKILEAFSSPKIEKKIRCHSTSFISPKNIIITPPNEEENEKEVDTKEYKIGNYIVKHTLGQGTFGKVKLGLYLPYEEKVAIKILEKNRIVEKDDEIRVKREFDMLAKFNHPNVILVAEIFESEDSFYSVMEYCEGGELFNYIVKKTRLSEEESAFFFYQLINGLEYIHSLGIVHRDLKPENLLLTNEHLLKIIDFGLSNYFKENQDPLLSTPCGSPCYASPEMVAGKKYDGFKIDVWSCGIILYAMLCGYLPFEDPDNEVLFKKILECDLEFPSYVKKLSIDLIKKILVTDPEKRITIDQIKKHPFYLKGKEIFDQEFSTSPTVVSPKEKEIHKENKNEENKENINNLNMNNNNNIEIKKPELIEINLDNKENINLNSQKIEETDKKIILDKEKKPEKIVEKEKEEKDKNEEKIEKEKIEKEKIDKEKIKKEKIDKEKINKEKIEKEKIKKDENKNNSDKLKISDKKEKGSKNKKEKYILTEQEEIYIPLKTEYTDSNYRLNINENNKEEKEKNKEEKENYKNKITNINPSSNNKTIETESKIPFRKLPQKSRIKMKDRKREKPKEHINEKLKEKLKENSKDINNKEKDKDKELVNQKKMQNKEKTRPKTLDKEKDEKLDSINKKKNDNTVITIQNPKVLNNQENKKTITPKKKIHYFKTLRIQRPTNLANISKNINLNIKGKTLKYLDHKNTKIVSAKEPLKIKSTFKSLNSNKPIEEPKKELFSGNYKKLSLEKKDNKINRNEYINTNINKFSIDVKDNLKLNKNKQKEISDDNKWQRLNTEILQNKNMNYLENRKTINYNNNTIDAIKNNYNFGYISDVNKSSLGNKNIRKKCDIKLHINFNNRRDKRKNNDIKRMKSTTFADNNNNNITMPINTAYNSSTINSYLKNPLKNKLEIKTNYAINDFPYGTNNHNYYYSNRKESEINDNIIKTEPFSEFFTKLNNKNSNYYSHIKTNTNANTIQSNKMPRGFYPKKLHHNVPTINFTLLNSIKKVPNNNIAKNNDILKNIPNSNAIRNTNINKYKRLIIPKNNETNIAEKKNTQFTIRNTVINVNMYETGLFMPSYNKNTLERKKNNIIGTYNTLSHIQPNKKYSKEPTDIYSQKTFNNPINKFPNLNNTTFKPIFKNKTITSNHVNNHSLSINQNNSLNNRDLLYTVSRRLKTQTIIPDTKISVISLNKLINRMKNKQNRRQSNSMEKNHNIFNSIKLNEILKSKNERKTIEINNLLSNKINSSNLKNNDKLRPINPNKNYTLPSLIVNNKNFDYSKVSIVPPHRKPFKFINPLQTSNISEGIKQYYIYKKN